MSVASFLKKHTLIEVTLLFLAHIGRMLLMKFLFLYGCVVALYKWELRTYLKSKAYIIDVEGNVTGKYFFNHTMRKKGGNDFGSPFRSISCETGYNIIFGTDTQFSQLVDKTLLESSEKDHCLKAVEIYEEKILAEAEWILKKGQFKLENYKKLKEK